MELPKRRARDCCPNSRKRIKYKEMNLKHLKIKLPKTWQESSRLGNENQLSIRINHISPLANMDHKAFQDESIPSSSDKVIITKIGISRFGSAPLKDFYRGMKMFILSGFAPPELNVEWLEKLWKGMTKTPGFERPGESDLSADISIARHPTKEIAQQSFKNMALMPTKGFDVPVPGGVQIPGMSKNTTMTGLLESDVFEKHISEGYMSKKQLEEIRSAIGEVQKGMPKVKEDFAKSGVKFKEVKYLGYRAICIEANNPVPKPKSSSPAKKIGGGTGMGTGGGGYTVLDPLPKKSQPYQEKIISYQAILVENFIIIGSLLWSVDSLPSGSTSCYSLSETKEKVHFSEGIKFIDIVPLVSNIAKEGYLYKEEVEKIIKEVIAVISG